MLELFASIDALDVSVGSGFLVFGGDVVMRFGPETIQGIEAVKDFLEGFLCEIGCSLRHPARRRSAAWL
ncbi:MULTISPECIES: hypothetical protein [Aphanothece]|uniref:hypothetical protein n=1 Tax=Aphanothece TaxID=1121 RepID=UPI00398F853D